MRWLIRIGAMLGIIIIAGIILLLLFREASQWFTMSESKRIMENGGVSELVKLHVNGTEQYLLIEGNSKDRPVLLFLHGGPGVPFPFGVGMRGTYPEITDHFVAVYYDQRGSGKSYANNIPMESMNIAQFAEDTDVVVDYLRDRFNREKIIVCGMSWGTIVGTQYSYYHPEKVEAYIGLSQFVGHTENQQRAIDWLVDIAERDDNKSLMENVRSLGEPLLVGEQEEQLMGYISQYGGDNYSDEQTKKASIFGMMWPALLSPDYSLKDIYQSVVSGAVFSLRKATNLQEEINAVNLVEQYSEFEVPVYFFQGKHDKITNYELAKEYFDRISASAGKMFITLEQSAHYPNEHDFNIMVETLTEVFGES